MSAYGAGKMAEGVMKFTFWAFLLVAVLVGAGTAVSMYFGPIWSAVAAAAIVYIISVRITGNWLTSSGQRLGSIPGAALGSYIGALVYASIGGIWGGILGCTVSVVLSLVLMILGWFTAATLLDKLFGKKKQQEAKKAQEEEKDN